MKVYNKDLPDKCCPLFRLEEALFIPRELIDIYLQPKCLIHEYRGGQKVVNSCLSSLTSILEVTEQADPGARVIVSASAGLGKSAFSSHATRLWCHGEAMDKYKLLYLLLPRYIHRHAEPIERIICTDLKLHATSAEAEVRRAIKANAENMAFIIDGYDEVVERDQRHTSLNQVISGEVAKDSKVVITTRPHCVNHLTELCQDTYVLVELLGLTTAASEEYVQRICAAASEHNVQKMCATEGDMETREQAARQIMAHIPDEAKHVPLLLNMAVIIYRWNREHPTVAKEFPEVRTVSDVIGRVIGMFLSLQVEKDEARDTLPVYASPLDERLPNHHLMMKFAEMSFESIKNGEFKFKSETLCRFRFNQVKVLSLLGFLEITHDDEGNVETARCLHNQILEYCAALHIADNSAALQYIINKIHPSNVVESDDSTDTDSDISCEADFFHIPYKKENLLSKSLGFWQDTLIFSVGINHEVLSAISGSSFALRVALDKEEDQHQCLDLSYEARLMHETDSTEAREQFCEALVKAPLKLTRANEVISCIYALFTKIKLLL